jgi:8-oxo-dGTP pyrophosphatase MutT (NUDIX family)
VIGRRRLLLGSRALCVSRGQLLLVEHFDPYADRPYWVLPGGGREAGETFAEAAIREVHEETGVVVRVVRRMRVPASQEQVTYALFLVEPVSHTPAVPRVDLRTEAYLRGAAWYPVTPANPIGPLDPAHWAYLGARIRRLLVRGETAAPVKPT